MGWLDELNRWALKRIRRQALGRVEVNGDGSTLVRRDHSRFIRWSDVQEIAVIKQPNLADSSFALAIRERDSTLTIVDDTVPGYAELCEELSRRLPGVTPYQKWATEFIANPDQAGQVIFRRTAD